ncbi:MAG: hypothetical protein ACI4PQ_08690 [Butyricicoccaceae bacterium]
MTEQDLKFENERWKMSVMLRALDVYGGNNQIVQAMEECNELAVALSHMKRFRTSEARLDMIEEMADVSIMIEQMKLAFDCHGEVDKKIVEKLARLDQRMEAGEYNEPTAEASEKEY